METIRATEQDIDVYYQTKDDDVCDYFEWYSSSCLHSFTYLEW